MAPSQRWFKTSRRLAFSEVYKRDVCFEYNVKMHVSGCGYDGHSSRLGLIAAYWVVGFAVIQRSLSFKSPTPTTTKLYSFCSPGAY